MSHNSICPGWVQAREAGEEKKVVHIEVADA